MDRQEVDRAERVVDVLVFRLAQAIVGEDGVIGGVEGVVAEGGEGCFGVLTSRLVLVCAGAPTNRFRAQLRGQPYTGSRTSAELTSRGWGFLSGTASRPSNTFRAPSSISSSRRERPTGLVEKGFGDKSARCETRHKISVVLYCPPHGEDESCMIEWSNSTVTRDVMR
jgi:hypothetical protein